MTNAPTAADLMITSDDHADGVIVYGLRGDGAASWLAPGDSLSYTTKKGETWTLKQGGPLPRSDVTEDRWRNDQVRLLWWYWVVGCAAGLFAGYMIL